MLWVFNNRHNSSSSSSKRQPRLVVTMPITQHLLPPVALPQLPPLNHFSNRHSLPSSCSYRRCRRRHSTLPFPARARFLSTTWVHWPGLRHSCQGSHHRLGSCRGRTHHQLGSPHLTLARHPHRRLHYPRDGVGEVHPGVPYSTMQCCARFISLPRPHQLWVTSLLRVPDPSASSCSNISSASTIMQKLCTEAQLQGGPSM